MESCRLCGSVTPHLPPRCVFRALGRFAAWGGGVRRGPLRGLGTWWAEIFGALFEKIVKNRSKKISALRGRCSSTDTCVCSRALKMQGSTQLTLLFRLVKFGVDLSFFRPKTASGKLMSEKRLKTLEKLKSRKITKNNGFLTSSRRGGRWGVTDPHFLE